MGTDHVLSWSAEYLAGCDVVRVTTALDGVPWTTTDVNRTFSNLGWTENALAKQHRSMEGPWDAEYTHIEWAPGDVTAPDCNSNDIPDSCDITAGTSQDEDSNGIPDECEVEGGLQRPGDGNQDGKLDLSDAIWLLGHLFLGTQPKLPCEGGTASSPGAGDRAVADVNGDGKIDLSDPVSILSFLSLGSKPPALGTECVRIAGCPEKCQ